MKTPEEYIGEFIQPQVLSITSITRMAYQIQKDSYNQAIEDAANNAVADHNIVGDSDFAEDSDIECYVVKGSILELKIK